jgi:hypothetical protein
LDRRHSTPASFTLALVVMHRAMAEYRREIAELEQDGWARITSHGLDTPER